MTATKIIKEIKRLPPEEQAEVIVFAAELARTHKLSGQQLSDLAKRMAESDDPAEVQKLRETIARGFYGSGSHA